MRSRSRSYTKGATRPAHDSSFQARSILPQVPVRWDKYPVNERVKPKPPKRYRGVKRLLTDAQVREMRLMWREGGPWPWGGIGGQSFCQHWAHKLGVKPSVIKQAVIDEINYTHVRI